MCTLWLWLMCNITCVHCSLQCDLNSRKVCLSQFVTSKNVQRIHVHSIPFNWISWIDGMADKKWLKSIFANETETSETSTRESVRTEKVSMFSVSRLIEMGCATCVLCHWSKNQNDFWWRRQYVQCFWPHCVAVTRLDSTCAIAFFFIISTTTTATTQRDVMDTIKLWSFTMKWSDNVRVLLELEFSNRKIYLFLFHFVCHQNRQFIATESNCGSMEIVAFMFTTCSWLSLLTCISLFNWWLFW